MKGEWISVADRLPKNYDYTPLDRDQVDVWMSVHASPLSFGIADAFRVPDAWRRGGKWFHRYRG